MTTNSNTVLTKRITTEVAIFVNTPTAQEVNHLRQSGFSYERGQWSRTTSQGAVHPSQAVLEFGSWE